MGTKKNSNKAPLEKTETSGKNSPAVIVKNGNVTFEYGDASKKDKKTKWQKILIVVSILAAVAGFTGYTLKDFFFKEEIVEIPEQVIETNGNNSPAVITNDGDASFTYDEKEKQKDSAIQKNED